MRRKVISQGSGALTVSLPVDWIRKYGVKKGDYLLFREEDKKLILSPSEKGVANEREIELDGKSETLKKILLTGLYISGVDSAVINGEIDDFLLEAVEKNYIGFEVLEHKEDMVRLSVVSDPNQMKVGVLIERVFTLLISTMKEIKKMYERNEDSPVIKHNIQKVNQYINYCRRCIFINGYEKGYFYWSILVNLKIINVTLGNLVSTALSYGEESFDIFSFVEQSLMEFRMHFKKKDFVALQKLHCAMGDYYFSFQIKKIKETSGENSVVICFLNEISRQIYHMITPSIALLI